MKRQISPLPTSEEMIHIPFSRKPQGAARGHCSKSAEESRWGFCSQYRSNSQNSWSYIAHNAAASKPASIIVSDLTKCHTSHRKPQLFLQAVSSPPPWLVNSILCKLSFIFSQPPVNLRVCARVRLCVLKSASLDRIINTFYHIFMIFVTSNFKQCRLALV